MRCFRIRDLVLLVSLVALTSCARWRGTATTLPALQPSSELPPQTAVSGVEPVRQTQALADKEEREDGYREAAEFYRLKRAGEDGEIPMERYLEAKRHMATMPRYSIGQRRFVEGREKARAANLGTWSPLGPGNIGGRTRSLIIRPDDPNTLWAGAVGGGIWKTTDGGASWQAKGDLLPSIGISAMALDPANPDVLYAGSGEWYTGSTRGDAIRGLGIYKSTDGGETWNLLPATTTTSFYYVNKIVVSPVDSNRIYAATWSGVLRSLDGGETWRSVLARSSPNFGCQDLVARTDQSTDYLFASCIGATSAVFRNRDAAGATAWQSVLTATNMNRVSFAIAPSNQNIIYGLAASQETGDNSNGLLAVFRSLSSGEPNTWDVRTDNKNANRLNRVQLSNPRDMFADVCTGGKESILNQGEYDNAIAVDPLNPDIVWTGGVDIMRSEDGGANWGIASFWEAGSQNAHADVHALLFHPGYDGRRNQTLLAATDGGVYFTSNATAATATGPRAACAPYNTQVRWRSLNNGYAATQFYHGAVYPGGASYFGGTQDNGTVQGFDAVGTSPWLTISGGDGGFVAVDPKDPNILFAETTNLSLRRSVNGGFSFATATRGISEPSGSFLFITPFLMDPSDSTRLYIGGRTLWRTTDSAANWSEASATIGTTNGSISAVAVAPSDPNRMVFGTSTGRIYRNSSALSTDKTTIWENTLPRTGYLSRLTFDPQNADIVYATYSQFKSGNSQNHVYKSTDGGASWVGIDGTGDTALPDIPVYSLILDPQNTSTLYLGSDIGVFVSLDGGATWATDDNPFANAVTEVLVLDRSAGATNLYAFTHGRGAWKTTLPDSPGACEYKVATAPIRVSALAQTPSIAVDTADGCAWSAVSLSGPFPIVSPAGGSGKGRFGVNVTLNQTTVARTTDVSIQDKTITVQQDAAVRAAGNDSSATPFAITNIPGVVVEDTTAATEQTTDRMHSCTNSADFKTVWYSITAQDSGTLQIGFRSARLDNGADSGSVLTVYSAAGTELGCSVTPQGTTVITTRTRLVPVVKGDRVLVEVSATLFGAPTGARLLGGNLALLLTLVK